MKRDPTMLKAIQRAGGVSALARQLGITRQAIYAWSRIPVEHVFTIEQMSGVPRHTLRPDVYPREDAPNVA
ncbi:MAG: Cro/CI family transcriptional regulator [Rhodovibrio sp.]|nr:Cro/CI family transcriptional regulator [Rhodovibrio sp.]